ncbi:facilitated trehalose transporter Tret1-like isoform X2 [Leptidea sinapis]|uniref:facilitated trehalose transporter Tret1-like isoform X2 n=1 Tax=Leptidea sinapis TaxID=189913 RepID=UPI00213D1BFA|nr:facilitated trehalose transporter Tret1-like isoform X2 [Leptidea sinapis]
MVIFYNNILLMYTLDNYITNNGLLLWQTSSIDSFMDFGSTLTVSIMIFTEYTSPKYRGVFLTVKAATFFWGVWVANVIGAYYHWKNIVTVMTVCCVLSSSIILWPESPMWLASKGRFDECAKIHRWLNGQDTNSEKELSCLIKLQKTKLSKNSQNKGIREVLLKYIGVIKLKTIYKPIIFTVLSSLLYICSGKLACSVYAITIIRKITITEEAAYNDMLILDGFTILGMYVGCVLSKYCKRRKILIYTSLTEVLFLFILSLYMYLIKSSIITENQYFTIVLLTIFSTAVSCGPIILGPCICGELAPIKYRSIYFSLSAIVMSTLIATTIKITPVVFENFEMHIFFLLSGLSTSVVIVLVYKYLPETKDKTVQEIQRLLLEGGIEIKEEIAEDEMSVRINGGDSQKNNIAMDLGFLEQKNTLSE